MSSNARKDALLGEPHGTAQAKLRKALLFKYVQLAGHDVCCRCDQRIESLRDFSVEHKRSWQESADQRAAFFDLATSHFRVYSATWSPARKLTVIRLRRTAFVVTSSHRRTRASSSKENGDVASVGGKWRFQIDGSPRDEGVGLRSRRLRFESGRADHLAVVERMRHSSSKRVHGGSNPSGETKCDARM